MTQNSASASESTKSAFVIKFKSCVVRQHVLQTKRAYGALKLSKLVQTDEDSEILLFEMLPRLIHDLKLCAKDKAKPLGYKFIWASNGTVFVQKSEKTPAITITTEEDLKYIV